MQQIKTIWQLTFGKILYLLLIVLACYACAATTALAGQPASTPPTADPNQARLTAEAQAWSYVTQTAQALPTLTATLTPIPAPSNTPAPTNSPAPTEDQHFTMKFDGFYLVGSEIAPGVWKSNGSGNACYWEVTTKDGTILNNFFGMAGGTAYIAPNAFQVRFQDCGAWTYLQAP